MGQRQDEAETQNAGTECVSYTATASLLLAPHPLLDISSFCLLSPSLPGRGGGGDGGEERGFFRRKGHFSKQKRRALLRHVPSLPVDGSWSQSSSFPKSTQQPSPSPPPGYQTGGEIKQTNAGGGRVCPTNERKTRRESRSGRPVRGRPRREGVAGCVPRP